MNIFWLYSRGTFSPLDLQSNYLGVAIANINAMSWFFENVLFYPGGLCFKKVQAKKKNSWNEMNQIHGIF